MLVKAISCVKFGNGCPTTVEGKNETYQIVLSEVTKIVQRGNEFERQQALELLDFAVAYKLSR